MTARSPLDVWLYDTLLGSLGEDRNGRLHLTWSPDAYQRWGAGSRVMSHLLPLGDPRGTGPHPARVRVFVAGLLPEGNARTNYAMDVGVASDDVFGLISRYGRDTAGALVFQPAGESAPGRAGRYVRITEAEVGERLLAADRHSPTDAPRRGVESISLAGMQPKIGLHRSADGQWQACRDGAPSSHIVKLAHPDGSDAHDVIDTEVLCLDLARRVGLSNVQAEIHDFGGVRAIAVRRYDRTRREDGRPDRIHQEDTAQALGIDTDDPDRKFQRGKQLPSLAAIADILRAGGAEPDNLLRLTTFNRIIGNTDAHAKNISILRYPDGAAALAPAYDVAMHLHHSRPAPLAAMDVNGKYRIREITADDLIAEGRAWGLPERRARRAVTDTAEALAAALDEVDLDEYAGVTEAALGAVRDTASEALDMLADGARDISAARPPRGDIAVSGHRPAGAPARPHTRRRGPRRPR